MKTPSFSLLLKLVLTAMITTIIFATGVGAGYFLHQYLLDNQPPEDGEQNLSLYWEVWNRVEDYFGRAGIG